MVTYSARVAWIVRIYRRALGRCVVCGRRTDYYWYCSTECGLYDGTMSVRVYRNNDPNKFRPKKPSLLHGKHTEKWFKRENWN